MEKKLIITLLLILGALQTLHAEGCAPNQFQNQDGKCETCDFRCNTCEGKNNNC